MMVKTMKGKIAPRPATEPVKKPGCEGQEPEQKVKPTGK